MKLSTFVLSALVLTAPSLALAQPGGHGGGMHGFFTPEQRMMYMQEQRGSMDWKSMTPDQRHAQMAQIQQKFMSMSDADKQRLRSDMQSRFDALSPDQKQAVEQKIADRRARHQQMHQGGNADEQQQN